MSMNQKGKKIKKTSTKELEGRRVNGVLYLDRGVGTGCFYNVSKNSGGGDAGSDLGGHVVKPSSK